MNSRGDPLMSFFEGEQNKGESIKGEESTWNLLVQILLPLVLILTFVVVTEILGYKKAFIEMSGMVESVINIDENPPDFVARQKAIIDAQLQRLLLTVQQVKSEEEKRLNLTMFPKAEYVQRDGSTINDNNLKNLCEESKKNLQSDFSKQRYANNIYKKVLQKAGIGEPSVNISVKRWETEVIEDMSEAEKFKQLTEVKRTVICPQNRKIIHNHILDFCEGVKNEIKNLQESIIKYLFKELIDNPENLDEESSNIVIKLIDPNISDVERRRLANDLYSNITEKWHKKLDKEGYTFLDVSWEKLKVLD